MWEAPMIFDGERRGSTLRGWIGFLSYFEVCSKLVLMPIPTIRVLAQPFPFLRQNGNRCLGRLATYFRMFDAFCLRVGQNTNPLTERCLGFLECMFGVVVAFASGYLS
jgi:hypothetical protein